eukprot:6202308-Pleurochrysis_carterae.AAC.1
MRMANAYRSVPLHCIVRAYNKKLYAVQASAYTFAADAVAGGPVRGRAGGKVSGPLIARAVTMGNTVTVVASP